MWRPRADLFRRDDPMNNQGAWTSRDAVFAQRAEA